MAKKSFLIPVAVAVAALSFEATEKEANAIYSNEDNDLISSEKHGSLLMTPVEEKKLIHISGHASHGSHASHASHASHYSGR